MAQDKGVSTMNTAVESRRYESIAEIKSANESSVRAFGAIHWPNVSIESEVIDGRYFITSERSYDTARYSVRMADNDGAVSTVGLYQGFKSVEDAKAFIKKVKV